MIRVNVVFTDEYPGIDIGARVLALLANVNQLLCKPLILSLEVSTAHLPAIIGSKALCAPGTTLSGVEEGLTTEAYSIEYHLVWVGVLLYYIILELFLP